MQASTINKEPIRNNEKHDAKSAIQDAKSGTIGSSHMTLSTPVVAASVQNGNG